MFMFKKWILFIPYCMHFYKVTFVKSSLPMLCIHVVYLMSRYSCRQTHLIPGWWPRCGTTLRTPATTSLSLTSVNRQPQYYHFHWYSWAWIFVDLMKITCSFMDMFICCHQYSWAVIFVNQMLLEIALQ